MKFIFPYDIERDNGALLISFPDVPEAHTEVDDPSEAPAQALDCLIAALGGYIELRRDLPRAAPARGRPTIALPPLVAAKLALYQAMRTAKVSNVALAKRLRISEGAVRRLLDLDHRSHIEQVEAALAVLGKRLVVNVADAA
jgi:antitoxin HicB